LARPDTLQLAEWPTPAPVERVALPVHVVHVIQHLSDGPLAFVMRVVATLDELGFRQSLVSTRADGTAPPDLGALRHVAYVELPQGETVLAHARNLFRLLHQLTQQSDAVTVHMHATGPGLIERLLLAALPRRAQRLFTPHAMALLNPRRPLLRALHRVVERLAGLLPITPVGRGVGEAQTLARAWRRPAFVLEHPIDDCFFAVEAQPADAPVIICVGRAADHNAPELFAQLALRFEIDELPARFVWIGDGDAAQEARLRASGVQVIGHMATADVAAMLAGATVYLQTSVWEGMPVSLMSAMAAGLPCVVADVTSHRDVVVHGRTGFIVRDLDDFDRHVRWLLDEPELRVRLGEAARRECRQRFAGERFKAALQHLYGTGRALRAVARAES
jgi:glycosyltransferase involved in cell wall biosynthesis